MTSLPAHKPDLSKRRRRLAYSMLREAGKNPSWPKLSDEAKLHYAIGLFICDESGRIGTDAMRSALDDDVLVAYASSILVKLCL